ncbi:hypothetical protein M427DRAFT_397618 [Gonapodya prolifera JEL478]|uniref:DUF4515 domain-containing protein n=1 Tax=Gonapodya prolifera (strain JEL478) TaxID=1344416 RepID=A0A139A6X3_GONPJ|nr:hypothetical protein M427DRAFT_397618 [Gonapodya prolifera JEL478]|eukprot:KXS12454.1 hypothetical protein M427DRAFT_397618 [Gonapodya prolifera JEL478]
MEGSAKSGGSKKKKSKGKALPRSASSDHARHSDKGRSELEAFYKLLPPSVIGEIKLEDLNEDVLRAKLAGLDKSLSSLREKHERLRAENSWYRREIDNCQTDTAEYIAYLEANQSTKQAAIDKLAARRKEASDVMDQKRREAENALRETADRLKEQIADLDVKLETKNQEVMALSDVMSKRAKHEAEIVKLKKEMSDMEAQHKTRLEELERRLLETRIKLQREADAKLQNLEAQAHAEAATFLQQHTNHIELENSHLEQELRSAAAMTQSLVDRKARLEKRLQVLRRENRLREDVVRIRLEKARDGGQSAERAQCLE